MPFGSAARPRAESGTQPESVDEQAAPAEPARDGGPVMLSAAVIGPLLFWVALVAAVFWFL